MVISVSHSIRINVGFGWLGPWFMFSLAGLPIFFYWFTVAIFLKFTKIDHPIEYSISSPFFPNGSVKKDGKTCLWHCSLASAERRHRGNPLRRPNRRVRCGVPEQTPKLEPFCCGSALPPSLFSVVSVKSAFCSLKCQNYKIGGFDLSFFFCILSFLLQFLELFCVAFFFEVHVHSPGGGVWQVG